MTRARVLWDKAMGRSGPVRPRSRASRAIGAIAMAAVVGLAAVVLGRPETVVAGPAGGAGAMLAGSAAPGQIWALLHLREHGGSGQDVRVEIPLEWLCGHQWLTDCRGASGPGNAKMLGSQLLEQFRSLPIGESRVVRTLDCSSFDVDLSVTSRMPMQGPKATKLHVRLLQPGEDSTATGLSMSLPFFAARSLVEMMGSRLSSYGTASQRQAVLDSLTANVDLLKTLPPFRLARVSGKIGTVLVRTE
jgi:hypothetical protein